MGLLQHNENYSDNTTIDRHTLHKRYILLNLWKERLERESVEQC